MTMKLCGQALLAGALAISLNAVSGCGERTPTSAEATCPPLSVYASETWYQQRPEAEQIFRGTLTKDMSRCDPPGLGRKFCYSLQGSILGGSVPVMHSMVRTPQFDGTKEFDQFVGKRVAISGKAVDAGYGTEVWPARIDCE